MHYRFYSFFNILHFLVDLFILNAVYIICCGLFNQLWFQQDGTHFFSLLFQFNICWFLIVWYSKYYNAEFAFIQISRTTLRVVFQFSVLIIISVFLMKFQFTSRIFLLTYIFSLFVTLLFWKYMYILYRKKFQLLTMVNRKAIFIGSGNIIEDVKSLFSSDYSGYDLLGTFSDEHTTANHLGTIQDSLDFIKNSGITAVFSSVMPTQHEVVKTLSLNRDQLRIRLIFVPDFKLYFNSDVSVDLHDNLAFISFRKEPLEDFLNLVKKRMFDLLFSFFIWGILLWWLLPIIAILVKLTSKGPILFKQLRSGRSGTSFVCYKFRTMTHDSSSASNGDSFQKPSITKVGAFLRKTSLDELPQFINVLIGNMSIVGPRPHMLADTEEYRAALDAYIIRLYLKPGITGLAQVSGNRGKLSIPEMTERLNRDIFYMENWGLWLDVQIILKTILLLIKGDPKAQ